MLADSLLFLTGWPVSRPAHARAGCPSLPSLLERCFTTVTGAPPHDVALILNPCPPHLPLILSCNFLDSCSVDLYQQITPGWLAHQNEEEPSTACLRDHLWLRHVEDSVTLRRAPWFSQSLANAARWCFWEWQPSICRVRVALWRSAFACGTSASERPKAGQTCLLSHSLHCFK